MKFKELDYVGVQISHNLQNSYGKIFSLGTLKLLPDDDILLMLYYMFYLFLLCIGQH